VKKRFISFVHTQTGPENKQTIEARAHEYRIRKK
jgi:hypothetical protein